MKSAATTHKRCPKCGETKPRSKFHRGRSNHDGLQSQCKACQAVARHAHHLANREKESATGRAYYLANREAINAAGRARHAANREADNAATKACRLANLEKYNITRSLADWQRAGMDPLPTWPEYLDLVAAQGGRCAICRKPPENGRRLDLDHDHVTGAPRGALCNWDNAQLAKWERGERVTPAQAERFVSYLAGELCPFLGDVAVLNETEVAA